MQRPEEETSFQDEQVERAGQQVDASNGHDGNSRNAGNVSSDVTLDDLRKKVVHLPGGIRSHYLDALGTIALPPMDVVDVVWNETISRKPDVACCNSWLRSLQRTVTDRCQHRGEIILEPDGRVFALGSASRMTVTDRVTVSLTRSPNVDRNPARPAAVAH